MTSILLPHKKRNSYWVFGIPDSDITSNWYDVRPSDEYLKLWEAHVKTYDKPDQFRGDFRQLFGYTKAAAMFDDALKKYK